MSRRSHHPIRRHVRPRHPEVKRGAPTSERPDTVAEPGVEEAPATVPELEVASHEALAQEPSVPDEAFDEPTDEPVGGTNEAVSEEPAVAPAEVSAIEPPGPPTTESPPEPAETAVAEAPPAPPVAEPVARVAAPAMPAGPIGSTVSAGPPGGATAPQLRRFIKSRSYIPMHELRRRFGIVVEDDDVSAIAVGGHTVYVGLPPREGALLGELLRAGDIGYEASFDPVTPVIVGVFPIRPVTRG